MVRILHTHVRKFMADGRNPNVTDHLARHDSVSRPQHRNQSATYTTDSHSSSTFVLINGGRAVSVPHRAIGLRSMLMRASGSDVAVHHHLDLPVAGRW